jgi:hypothetical protein
MPIRVFNEDKGTEVDEEEILYPRRVSNEESSTPSVESGGVKNESQSPLVSFIFVVLL